MTDKSKAVVRILFGVVMLLVGVTFALLFNGINSAIGVLGQKLGLALIVTGSVSVFQEAVLSPLRRNELREDIGRISDQTGESFERVFGLLRGPGIYMLSSQRRGHPHYHKWLLEKFPQEMFFAGHSVLHRVQADFKNLGLLSVDEALKQKVSEGSKIRILFLDPTWDFIGQIAEGEGQEPIKLRTDLATTLGICKKLWKGLEDEDLAGDIEIRACRELKQYAFHHVSCGDRDEDEMLVGFYFARRLGMRSPLFVVENEQIKEFLVEHFSAVFDRAERILTYSRLGVKDFNHAYYRSCQDSLASHLSDRLLAELCP